MASDTKSHHLTLVGPLDFQGTLAVEQRLGELASVPLVIDLSNVTAMDSSGLALIIREWKKRKDDGSVFIVHSKTPGVRKKFADTGLENVLPFSRRTEER